MPKLLRCLCGTSGQHNAWANREYVLEAVKDNGLALKLAAKALKGDHEVVMEAVKQRGGALEYAAEALKSDRKIVLEAGLATCSRSYEG